MKAKLYPRRKIKNTHNLIRQRPIKKLKMDKNILIHYKIRYINGPKIHKMMFNTINHERNES